MTMIRMNSNQRKAADLLKERLGTYVHWTDIAQHVYGTAEPSECRATRMLIYQLRRKHYKIKSVPGTGFYIMRELPPTKITKAMEEKEYKKPPRYRLALLFLGYTPRTLDQLAIAMYGFTGSNYRVRIKRMCQVLQREGHRISWDDDWSKVKYMGGPLVGKREVGTEGGIPPEESP